MCRVILKHLLHSLSPEWCYAVVFSPYPVCEILLVFLISNQSNKNIQRLSPSQGHCFIVFLTPTLSLVLISQVHSALCVFVFVCMLGFTCMYHVECVLLPSSTLPLSCCLPCFLTSRPSLSPMLKWVICPWQERKREQVLWIRLGLCMSGRAHVPTSCWRGGWLRCSLFGETKQDNLPD